jgi:hypothetical protein
MCTPYMSNCYLCDFLEIIGNKKLEKMMGQMKRYAISIYSGLES